MVQSLYCVQHGIRDEGDKMGEKLVIVIPAYNEQENIGKVIDDWYEIVERYGKSGKLVIIDDGSTDDTYQIMKEYARSRPKLEPLTKTNSGHGATVLFGYQYALENGADYIFQTDSDGQTVSSEFVTFWNHRNAYDMIIGWRHKRQDGRTRIFVTKILKLVIRICFGVRVKDANTPFRLMKASTLKKEIGIIPKDFQLSNVIIPVIYEKKHLAVKYIPITFRPRQGGTNSIHMKEIIKIGVRAFADFRKINKIIR